MNNLKNMEKLKKENYKVPVFNWCKELEESAMKQIDNLAQLPFAYHHIGIMPDCHCGYGMPIGGVLATKGVVIPNAVGVDIGCGMCAVKTSLTDIDTETLKKIMGEIRKVIPTGFSHHKEAQSDYYFPYTYKDACDNSVFELNNSIIEKEFESARKQISTLGGGNHFIEIQKGDDGHIWIMIHSGSRNLGLKVANHYNKLAVGLNEKWHSSIPKKWELAFLPLDSEEGQAYLREMQYCVDFALANRREMMQRIINVFRLNIKEIKGVKRSCFATGEVLFSNDRKNKVDDEMINIAHNYASLENHFGVNCMVHRKGATLARKDTIGIIPGSQGTFSYIVKGKGNPDSFESCSHGAGRVMGRKQAIRELDLAEEIKKLDDKGIIHGIRNVKDLDEASGAYKPIDEVMKQQEDLVEILVKLQPLGVIKA